MRTAPDRRQVRRMAREAFHIFASSGCCVPGFKAAGIGFEFHNHDWIVHLTASGAILTVQVSP
jgi:hypothetical protein